MSKYKYIKNPEEISKKIKDALNAIHKLEDPAIITEYRKLFTKEVSIFSRSNVSAYLIKKFLDNSSFLSNRNKNRNTHSSYNNQENSRRNDRNRNRNQSNNYQMNKQNEKQGDKKNMPNNDGRKNNFNNDRNDRYKRYNPSNNIKNTAANNTKSDT